MGFTRALLARRATQTHTHWKRFFLLKVGLYRRSESRPREKARGNAVSPDSCKEKTQPGCDCRMVPCIYYTDCCVEVAESFAPAGTDRRVTSGGETNYYQATTLSTHPKKRFAFDAVVTETAAQHDVYETVGASIVN
ncbi:hypothetical protein TraAM80_10222 [Trypanosoma rangeli]|uniref:Kinesin motor domain-containing protein n=1 Tax=Trypanosoma rangeli TaxID=5698 RepID=A0A3R7KJ15_TRYRA|nr:uncharacterized protein TraAM80_10222 [Trypanosoma rangeli]RNE95434.1 hypothetical protein TraAM80_10222 [Trypanosoma rangeli]|eukprot:RNE95434.1 hypothetical protein TraAM80_10222 [Trypanosoma rangeli]